VPKKGFLQSCSSNDECGANLACGVAGGNVCKYVGGTYSESPHLPAGASGAPSMCASNIETDVRCYIDDCGDDPACCDKCAN